MAQTVEQRRLSHAAASRAYYAKNVEARRAVCQSWKTRNREKVADYNAAYWEEHRIAILSDRAACWQTDPEFRQHVRDYRHAHLSQEQATNRRCKARRHAKILDENQKRRATKKQVTVEHVDRRTVYIRDDGRCHLCGCKVLFKKMHLDHVKPLSKGGAHSYANVRVSCSQCNLRKGNRTGKEA